MRKYYIQLRDAEVPSREDREVFALEPGKVLGGDADGNPTNLDYAGGGGGGGSSQPDKVTYHRDSTDQSLPSGSEVTVLSKAVTWTSPTSKKIIYWVVGGDFNNPVGNTSTIRVTVKRNSTPIYDETWGQPSTAGTTVYFFEGDIEDESSQGAVTNTYSITLTFTQSGTGSSTANKRKATLFAHEIMQ